MWCPPCINIKYIQVISFQTTCPTPCTLHCSGLTHRLCSLPSILRGLHGDVTINNTMNLLNLLGGALVAKLMHKYPNVNVLQHWQTVCHVTNHLVGELTRKPTHTNIHNQPPISHINCIVNVLQSTITNVATSIFQVDEHVSVEGYVCVIIYSLKFLRCRCNRSHQMERQLIVYQHCHRCCHRTP